MARLSVCRFKSSSLITINYEALEIFNAQRRFMASKRHRVIPKSDKLRKLDQESYERMREDLSVEMKRKQLIKFKTIQRKEFSSSPLANILTWKAKEQLKYLTHLTKSKYLTHQIKSKADNSAANDDNEPRDWEEIRARILDVFPISPMSLGRVVKQLRMVMKDEQDILNHDRRVARRWDEMLELPFERLPSEALKQTVIDLVSSGQIQNIVNANGVEGMEEYGTPTKSQQVQLINLPESGSFYSLYKIHGSNELNQPETPLDVQRLLQLTKTDEFSDSDDEEKTVGSVPAVDNNTIDDVLKGIQLKYSGVDHDDLEKLMLPTTEQLRC